MIKLAKTRRVLYNTFEDTGALFIAEGSNGSSIRNNVNAQSLIEGHFVYSPLKDSVRIALLEKYDKLTAFFANSKGFSSCSIKCACLR